MYICTYISISLNCAMSVLHVRRLTMTEREEIEYKKDVYTLAKEHEQVC